MITIGSRKVGYGCPVFIIAEIGSNHNGSISQAKDLIAAAAEAGVDAVKFQSIKFDEMYVPRLTSKNLRTLVKSIELSEDWYPSLSQWCRRKKVEFLSSPTYCRAIELLEQVGVPAYKIASPQSAAHLDLLRCVAKKKKPLIISTGYGDYGTIASAVKTAYGAGNREIVILHCVSEYPAPFQRTNLKAMATLRAMFDLPVGFSDHSLGTHVPVAAVALGACVIEKHFTLSRKQRGPDHYFALEPKELKEMVAHIRDIEQSLGDGLRLESTDHEKQTLSALRIRLVAKEKITKGARLGRNSFILRRAPHGILAEEFPYVKDAVAVCNIAPLTPLTWDKLKFTN